MARILVVDDSLFARTALTRLLGDAGHQLLPPVSSGEAAIEVARRERPDLILMDLAMPGLDGLEATRAIMMQTPTRILVLSAAGGNRRRETLRTLEAGAIDFIPKPAAADLAHRGDELLERIEFALAARPHPRSPTAPRGGPLTDGASFPALPAAGFTVIAVGISTGGPSALGELLAPIPASLPVPIVVAQHILPGWTQSLAEQLRERTALRVREVVPLEPLQAGTVYLGPGDFDVEITRGLRARLTQEVGSGCRPSADVLLASLARSVGPKALALVMTGMGNDGLEGARQVRQAGGVVLVQDEESSVVWGMPGSVFRAGLAQGSGSPGALGIYLSGLAGGRPPGG